jgi:membrane-associated phospholipid phosphatase
MQSTTSATPRGAMTTHLALIGGGLAVLVAGMIAVRDGVVGTLERTVFHAVNDLPGVLTLVLWPVLQLGSLLAAPIVVLVALLLRRWRLAIAALAVLLLKLIGERLVKAAVSRQRPWTSIGPDIHLHGHVPLTGESFVSGHAMLAAALAVVVTPYLPGRWKVVPAVLAALVAVGRVYVGAHAPLDVLCGAAGGVVIGAIVDLLVRRPVGVRPAREEVLL